MNERSITGLRILSVRWAPAIYFVLGQVAWFACVLSAARGMSYIGISVVIVLILLHLLRAEKPLPEAKLVAAVLVIGAIWESTVILLGLMAYPNSVLFHGLAPLWILALWASFAAQFNTTYRWLKQRVAAGALLGAFAGPLSFRAGAALGAVRFVKPWPTAITLAAGWAVILSVIILLSRRWDGVRT